ncbi:hypothetical protein DesfrDRAFT_0074 [Solidesulfovibrio fructosivorans JJ]]|uniref:Uncharacterized protein n=1 Tax=Solidesulfovibrio fructosivorans JJ] TaxID=596151 RepID=E1JR25_SOLFR|nr:hypothetical protein [Solidesulfovibrio fructosivorans]EFL53026.1 hypothetical protein DesfrDRAFT_0074 [Solidesulfovibrio fructosivorans JJ]]
MKEQALRRKERHYSKDTPVCCHGCTFFKILNDSGHYLCAKDDGPVRKFSWCREYKPA